MVYGSQHQSRNGVLKGYRLNRRIIKYVNIVVFSLITLLVIAVMALLFAGLVSQKEGSRGRNRGQRVSGDHDRSP